MNRKCFIWRNKDLIIKLKRRLRKKNYDVQYKFDIQDNTKLAVIDGWKDFVVHEPDQIIIDYIDRLSEQGELSFDRNKLLKVIGINPK